MIIQYKSTLNLHFLHTNIYPIIQFDNILKEYKNLSNKICVFFVCNILATDTKNCHTGFTFI